MKKIAFLLLLMIAFTSCREQKKEEKMMPVEADGGIGDGAPPLDSLVKAQKDSSQLQQKNNSL
tara:strand:- start:2557 stop:2745 length:189 start_codon:yes stop_codon:yes gene_type:complete